MTKKFIKKMIKKTLSYLYSAMILAFSSVALIAAVFAKDVFGEKNPYLATIIVLLSILYFMMFLLIERYCSRCTCERL